MDVKVVKRDGSLEDFDCEKIKTVVMAAGLDEGQANTLCDNIESFVKYYGKDHVTAVKIRDNVIVEIQKLDKGAAKNFINYEKIRDKTA